MKEFEQWNGFEGRLWKEEVNVRDFIQNNYTQYDGDEEFLAEPTDATNRLWGNCLLYTSDAADEEDSVDLGGRRVIEQKKKKTYNKKEHQNENR